MKRYLFVSGSPRSGTTALTTLLNWNADVMVGQERYANLFLQRQEQFLPSLFVGGRYAAIQNGDCGYTSFDGSGDWNLWYAAHKDLARYDHFAVVGDKITELYRNYNVFSHPAWVQHDIDVIQILRRPEDVVASYDRRKADPEDAWTRDADVAVTDWSASIDQAWMQFQYRDSRFRFHIVLYESLFDVGLGPLLAGTQELYRLLGLKLPSPEQVAGFEKVYLNSEHRAKARTASSGDWRSHVKTKVSMDVLARYEYLKDHAMFL